MSTAYAFSFDMSRASLTPRASLCIFKLLHNGKQVEDEGVPVEHATIDAVNEHAQRLSERCGTAIECFTVRKVWL
jgi:hypothetical protein